MTLSEKHKPASTFFIILGICILLISFGILFLGGYISLWIHAYINAPSYESSTTWGQFFLCIAITLLLFIGGILLSLLCFAKAKVKIYDPLHKT